MADRTLMTKEAENVSEIVASIIAQLRLWGRQRPSDGLIQRQNLSEDSIIAIQAFALAAADTFEKRACDGVFPLVREQGGDCENCGRPVEIGQLVLCYDDVGEMHADCDHPFSLDYTPGEEDPDPVVLLGEPMRHVPLALLADRSK